MIGGTGPVGPKATRPRRADGHRRSPPADVGRSWNGLPRCARPAEDDRRAGCRQLGGTVGTRGPWTAIQNVKNPPWRAQTRRALMSYNSSTRPNSSGAVRRRAQCGAGNLARRARGTSRRRVSRHHGGPILRGSESRSTKRGRRCAGSSRWRLWRARGPSRSDARAATHPRCRSWRPSDNARQTSWSERTGPATSLGSPCDADSLGPVGRSHGPKPPGNGPKPRE